jgi:hypothetical protein
MLTPTVHHRAPARNTSPFISTAHKHAAALAGLPAIGNYALATYLTRPGGVRVEGAL